ncbi:MAG: dodecin domain-containing protein [Verrucomicrobia bacterium]|nr:dodecin domain-containing protein [Verrucomicrobiota bacterium]
MKNNIYKKLEIIGTSTSSLEDAINAAVARANKTVRNLRWFEVVETRGAIDKGKVAQWQVTIKIGFTLEG